MSSFHPVSMISWTHFWFVLQLMLVQSVFYEDTIPGYNRKDPFSSYYRKTGAQPRIYETIANIGNPSSVMLYNDLLFISLFMENKILLGSLSNRTVSGFADGSYCATNRRGNVVCGIVEGPWGMTTYNETLYVSQFGSDQILMFSLQRHNFGWFVDSFGDSDHLDCPEGIAVDTKNDEMYIANYNSNSIVVFCLKTQKYKRDLVSQSSTPWLSMPEDIAIDMSSNLLAVASFGNNSVLFFSTETGALVKIIGGFADVDKDNDKDNDKGIEDVNRTNAHVDVAGDIVVSQTAKGKGVGAVTGSPFHLSGPTGIALTPRKTFVVTLYRGQAVIEIDVDKGFLGILADDTSEKQLRGPTGIAYRSTSFIIASYDNKKILIFNSTVPTRSSAVLIDNRFSTGASLSSMSENESPYARSLQATQYI